MNRSLRWISCGVRPAAAGSKSHSAAIWDRNWAGSKSVIRRVAVRPSVSSCQNSLRVRPPGATTPTPVTTARRRAAGHRTAPVSRLGVDVAQLGPGRERPELEDEECGLAVVVLQTVPDADGDEQPCTLGQRAVLAVQPDRDPAADAEEELLGVGVPVLGDDLAGLQGERAKEAGGRADGGGRQDRADVPTPPLVRRYIVHGDGLNDHNHSSLVRSRW